MIERRVVVTGIGAVTPFGVGVKRYWENISRGNSAASLITSFDVSNLPSLFLFTCCFIVSQISIYTIIFIKITYLYSSSHGT